MPNQLNTAHYFFKWKEGTIYADNIKGVGSLKRN